MREVKGPFDPAKPPVISTALVSGKKIWYCQIGPRNWWVWDEFPLVEIRYIEGENGGKILLDQDDPRFETAKTEIVPRGTGDVIASNEAVLLKAVKQQIDGTDAPMNIHDVRRERDAVLEGLEYLLNTSFRRRLTSEQIEETEEFFDELRDVTEGHDKDGAPITGVFIWPAPPAFLLPHLAKVARKQQLRLSYPLEALAS